MVLHGGSTGNFVNNGIIWSPDGATFFNFQGQEFSSLGFYANMPSITFTTMISDNQGDDISYDAAGSFGPAGNFTHSCALMSALGPSNNRISLPLFKVKR